MIVSRPMRYAMLGLLGSTMLATGGTARAADLPDRFEAGRDITGEPCSVTRDWSRTTGAIKRQQDQPFVLTCRGVSAARLQGIVMTAAVAAADATQRNCGDRRDLAIAGIGQAAVRQCFDPALGLNVAELTVNGPRGTYVGAASPTALAPLVAVLKAATSGQVPTVTASPEQTGINLGELPPAPVGALATASLVNASPDAALQQGILMMRNGQHVEASRVLNDALSRLSAAVPPGRLAELQMATAVADSDLGQFEAADSAFAAARETLAANPSLENLAYLEDALRTYRALDSINRRQWANAVSILDENTRSASPLEDPITLSLLNKANGGALQTGSTFIEKSRYYALMLEVQKQYARSVAYLAQRRLPESLAALEGPRGAASTLSTLEQFAQPASLDWLRARIQLQHARIAAQKKDIDGALQGYDCAILTMRGLPQPAGPNCPVARSGSTTLSSALGASAIANIQLERASVAADRPGADDDALITQYDGAIDTMAQADHGAGSQPPALQAYFNLLLRRAKAAPSDALSERYFRGLQVVGDPAIAGDFSRLQDVVEADGTVGAKVRDRTELERQITQLRYQIAALPEADTAGRAALDQQRSAAESALAAINAELGANSRFTAQDDRPVTIAELRSILRPGEMYLKIVNVRERLYGIAINEKNSWIYGIDAKSSDIARLVNIVLTSARSTRTPEGERKIVPFEVETAFALFRTMTGPAYDEALKAKALVVDPAGPLRSVPIGILVADAASVKAYKASSKTDKFNYSAVRFVASQTDLSMALSPRSFTVVRTKVAPSTAPNAFLGLGENAASPLVSGTLANRPVLRGPNCSISYANWARIKDGNPPISARQLQIAADAFGVPGAPEITGEAFTDVAVLKASREGKLNQYQVLHFATHGLAGTPLEVDGCKSELPPSLVTTMAAPAEDGSVESEGLLSFAKVATLDLNANLVVLSACQTAVSTGTVSNRQAGLEDASGTLDGLVRAFITANARAVLATFWSVPASDQSNELMATFYRAGRTGTIGEALRAAQTSVIRQPEFSHPYYWGAYFVVGDTAKTMLTGVKTARADTGAAPEM